MAAEDQSPIEDRDFGSGAAFESVLRGAACDSRFTEAGAETLLER